jgi:UDP-N-acetylmuramyl pentapeptide phosphotransferase/UDP-N-acetylglucosamine-1-phosphate transferase
MFSRVSTSSTSKRAVDRPTDRVRPVAKPMGASSWAVLLPGAAAFAVSAWLARQLWRTPALAVRMLDLPNERSLHRGPVPRTGGMALWGGLLAAGAVALGAGMPVTSDWAWLAVAAVVVAAVSFLDDRRGVPPHYRFIAHLAAALVLFWGGVDWSLLELPGLAWWMPDVLALPLSVLFVVWMINLYNFMDGMDGFAAGMAVFGFGAFAVLGARGGDAAFTLGNTAIAAAAGGFLLSNFPPARIFLGDLGSATLGLLAAAMSLIGSQRGLFPLWVAWLAFSPFIVDATWTLVRRLVGGERIWTAHRSHHYQRLVLAGWGQRATLLRSYLLMAACGATAVTARGMSQRDQWWLLAGWSCIYFLIGLKTRLVERGAAARP